MLIAGAGPTGLALALALAKRGIPVHIIDKTDAPGTTSRAMAVHARTLELYGGFGTLAVDVIAAGKPVDTLHLWTRGHVRGDVPLGRFGRGRTPYPFILALPQDVHEKILIKHLEAAGVTVERRTELLGFDMKADGVLARLRFADGREEMRDYAYVCGCDGAHSIVRHQLGMSFDGGTYDQVFYVADVEAAGETAAQQPFFCLNDHDFCLVFPLHAETKRLIGVVPSTQKSATEISFADVAPRVAADTGLNVTRINWFSTYHVHHRMADSFGKGRVFLLGDAAHIHSPAGGQGMNTGIGDAINLAWKLADVMAARAPDSLLDTYAVERMAFARRLVATTDRVFRFAVGGGAISALLRLYVVPFVMPRLVRLPGFGAFMFGIISQIWIDYRMSAISQGASGRVQGGDRLPWVADVNNFAPLMAADWQAHVYGTLGADIGNPGVPVHCFPYSADARAANLQEGAVYLLRPDGYVAFAASPGDAAKLQNYIAAHKFVFGQNTLKHA
ncbi:MAG: FAD-dependent monooxygenase [Micavibrio sp.]|nr:FAD-dependent monooxygenase [Micavibrio sp.]